MPVARFSGSASTAYRDLLERALDAAFAGTFAGEGSFQRKTVRGRVYWYWRGKDRVDKYVGPESDELLGRVERNRVLRADEGDRREIVNMLVRAGYPRPPAEIGAILRTLARAGLFRQRACLVGTHAFGAYAGLLGVRLRGSSLVTQDLDIAQFTGISMAVAEVERIDILAELRKVDPSFRAHVRGLAEGKAYTFVNTAKLKVELLTANRGPDDDAPARLPSLGAHAHRFRFLDFLIRRPVPAVVLHGAGIAVEVPAPERFAVHKLIVAHRRARDALKSRKDLEQAARLIEALSDHQFDDLAAAWREARARGPAWRVALDASLAKLDLPSELAGRLIRSGAD
ncbi:MAG: GSU2403 family nucleotidyltransferase fold protein [Tagaea sp.]|nr:GSU2403 family nucleotidyltransferase fold protein [Tagaea sp.]